MTAVTTRVAERHHAVAPRVRSGRIVGLDGLRAFAVLLVIVYHLAPDTLPGGFIGVDVFFVISGFLITTLLLREGEAHHGIRLPSFWLRRARRLIPALVVVVVTSTVAAALVSRDLLVGVGRQTFGAATFLTNWVEVAAGSSYFDVDQPKLFQPFWSLAIEEQFYLLWPITLGVLIVAGRSWRMRARIAFGGAMASALWMAVRYTPGDDPTRIYYGTDTHAFGLLLGCAAAFALWGRVGAAVSESLSRRLPAAAVLTLVVLAASMHADSAIPYRGGLLVASGLAVIAVAGCAMAPESGYVRVLENPVLRWIGERSYGLYLWHWPVMLIIATAVPSVPGTSAWWTLMFITVLTTFTLAWASYRFVETPIRRDGFRVVGRRWWDSVHRGTAPRIAAAAVAVMVLGAAAACATAPQKTGAEEQIEQGDALLAQTSPSRRPSAVPAPTPSASSTGTGKPSAPTTTPVAAPVKPHVPTGTDLSAFGDSTLSAAVPAIATDLVGADVHAKPIRKWSDAPGLVKSALSSNTLRSAVVLAFGTNGGFQQFAGGPEAFKQTIGLIGPKRQIFVVNVVTTSSWMGDYNRQLTKLAGGYPNVHVVDWASAVAGHPELLHTDRIHANMQGIKLYTKVLKAAFAKTTVS